MQHTMNNYQRVTVQATGFSTPMRTDFFDCLDLVDEKVLATVIHELGLPYLKELPDLRELFSPSARRKKEERKTVQNLHYYPTFTPQQQPYV